MSIQLHLAHQKRKSRRKIVAVTRKQLEAESLPGYNSGVSLNSQYLLISALLPPAVKEFLNQCEEEVEALCGPRYSRGMGENHRWSTQRGSICIGGQRVAVAKPRVRGLDGEQVLQTYARFQDPAQFKEQVFVEGLRHVSQRDYKKGLPKIGASFGFSKSSVSRAWIEETQAELDQLLSRDLSQLSIVAVFIDGKRFSKQGVVIALGVRASGEKIVLGIYQSSTEHSAACRNLLDDLERRGLPDRELLFVVDGGSGLNKALSEKYDIENRYRRRAVRVRCFVHKWRNLKDVLTEPQTQEVGPLFWAIQEAKDLTQAQECAKALELCLSKYNESALRSFLEAKEDLLMIHQLGLSQSLKKFFSSTNPIESLNYLIEEDLRRVKNWKDSRHFQRWVAAACLQNEERMRRIRGYSSLPPLRVRLQSLCCQENAIDNEIVIA
jgi:putative transposase